MKNILDTIVSNNLGLYVCMYVCMYVWATRQKRKEGRVI